MKSLEIRRIEPDEVKQRLDAGEDIVLVDVRKPQAFANLHIAGARPLPLPTIEEGAHGLPRDRKIVLY
jgi:rhodanese-related sulfurtransferase